MEFTNFVTGWPNLLMTVECLIVVESVACLKQMMCQHSPGGSGYTYHQYLMTPFLYPETRVELNMSRDHIR